MNKERLQMLRDMMEGIPADKVNMNVVEKGDGTPCGSVCCMYGWARMYPPFIKAGINRQGVWTFFGLSLLHNLFSPRRRGERGTHKEVALGRLDKILGKAPALAKKE